jgi:hypothetical protein
MLCSKLLQLAAHHAANCCPWCSKMLQDGQQLAAPWAASVHAMVLHVSLVGVSCFGLKFHKDEEKKCNLLIENEEGQFLEHGNFF